MLSDHCEIHCHEKCIFTVRKKKVQNFGATFKHDNLKMNSEVSLPKNFTRKCTFA